MLANPLVRIGGTFPIAIGTRVKVEFDSFWQNEYAREADFDGLIEQNIHPGIVNSLDPFLNFIEMKSLTLLLSYAMGSGSTVKTEVAVRNFVYINYLGELALYTMPATARIDLADYEPAAGKKCLVHLWLNQVDNSIDVTTSTAIDTILPFDNDTDLAEVINTPPNSLCAPIAAWKFQNGQTAVTDEDMYMDTRQFINVPQRRAPARYRQGLSVKKLDNDTLIVGTGSVVVSTETIDITTTQVVDLATAANWIGGASLETASEWVHVYATTSGTILLSDKHPQYPVAATGSRVATMRVNQPGAPAWDGTAGQGLNATSVVYDGDTGEASITVGMYLQVYTDSGYTTGRGKGTGAAGSVNNLSMAKITAINTGTNTLTLEAGHQIAINDNDYLVVVEAEAMIYAYISTTWYRWLRAIYNDSGSNLTDIYSDDHGYTQNAGSDITTTSASFVDIDNANWEFDLITQGDVLDVIFAASGNHTTAGNYLFFDIEVDGTRIGGDSGIVVISEYVNSYILNCSFPFKIAGLLPGSHHFALQWKTSAATATLYAGSALDNRARFHISERNGPV